MSLGSLSPEMHENNAIAMNRLDATSNTGEGGEPPERFGTEKECSTKAGRLRALLRRHFGLPHLR